MSAPIPIRSEKQAAADTARRVLKGERNEQVVEGVKILTDPILKNGDTAISKAFFDVQFSCTNRHGNRHVARMSYNALWRRIRAEEAGEGYDPVCPDCLRHKMAMAASEASKEARIEREAAKRRVARAEFTSRPTTRQGGRVWKERFVP